MNNWGSADHAVGKPAVGFLTDSPNPHKGGLPVISTSQLYVRWNGRRKAVPVLN
jgi:hypothetical protein